MKIKQFRYMTSNIAGYFNDAVAGGIDFNGIKHEIEHIEKGRSSREKGRPIILPDYFQTAKTELIEAYKVKKECEAFISGNNVKSVAISNYTPHRHNNGGHNTIFECITILYEDVN